MNCLGKANFVLRFSLRDIDVHTDGQTWLVILIKNIYTRYVHSTFCIFFRRI